MKKLFLTIIFTTCFTSVLYCPNPNDQDAHNPNQRTEINEDWLALKDALEKNDKDLFNEILNNKFTGNRPDSWTKEQILKKLSKEYANTIAQWTAH